MPRLIDRSESLVAVVNVRVTACEKQHLQQEAEIASLSLSDLIRRRALGRAIHAKVDLSMVQELRRIGGLVKHIHNQTEGVYSKQTADVLIAIKSTIESIAQGHDL
jgi:hypothetical protein